MVTAAQRAAFNTGVTPAVTPTAMRAAAMVQQPAKSPAGMSFERRMIEKRRRDAIRGALGK